MKLAQGDGRQDAEIKEIQRSPYEGLGKPEPLKHQLAGWWSRRIDSEHRFLYRVTEQAIEVANLRHHC